MTIEPPVTTRYYRNMSERLSRAMLNPYMHQIINTTLEKGKQKSPGRATSRSRSQHLTPGGREKVTDNARIVNKQMHDKHKDQLPFPVAR